MRMRWIVSLLAVLFLLPARPASAGEYKNGAGPVEVDVVRYDLLDKARDRVVPVKFYSPKTGDGPFPVILFSHGLGGTREGYEYLGSSWASHGYVCVHVQHRGSDNAVWEGKAQPLAAMRAAAADPANLTDRPRDIRFVLDQLPMLNKDFGPFRDRLDLKAIGLAGHSFGAYTTFAVAGELFTLPAGQEITFADPRVKAAIGMSAPAPKRREQLGKAYGAISIPCFHMTGTLDDSPITDTRAADRRLPFDHMKGPDTYLVTFTGGDHMVFSGRPRGPAPKDELFQNLIRQSSLAFWDAYLKHDAGAKVWLAEGGFTAALGQDGTLEKK